MRQTQLPLQQNNPTILQNNFNQARTQIQQLIQAAKAVQNPVAYLQSRVNDSPLVKEALELGKKYNGDYDAATRAILQQNNLDPVEVKKLLSQLGIN